MAQALLQRQSARGIAADCRFKTKISYGLLAEEECRELDLPALLLIFFSKAQGIVWLFAQQPAFLLPI